MTEKESKEELDSENINYCLESVCSFKDGQCQICGKILVDYFKRNI